MSLPPLIDSGRFRAPCASCDGEIPRNEPRVAEPVNDGRVPNAKYRYHHFECAMEKLPKLVYKILQNETFDTALIPDKTDLYVELHERIDALDAGRSFPPRRMVIIPDPRIERDLIPQLIANPDDHGILAVLADLLTERGDPRGELIVTDLALADGAGSPEQLARQEALRYRLLPPVCDPSARATTIWGIGFVRRVELDQWHQFNTRGGYIINPPFTERWNHPSLRLLREVSVRDDPEKWLNSELPALRVLEIANPRVTALPAMPSLERLAMVMTTFNDALVRLLEQTLDGRRLKQLDLAGAIGAIKFSEPLHRLCDELIL